MGYKTKEKRLILPVKEPVKEYVYVEDACIEMADEVREIDLGKVKIRKLYNWRRICPQ